MGIFPTKIVLTKEVFLCEHRVKKVVTQIMKNPLFCFVFCFFCKESYQSLILKPSH